MADELLLALNCFRHLNCSTWRWDGASQAYVSSALPGIALDSITVAMLVRQYTAEKKADPACASKAAHLNREKMLEDTINELATSHAVLLRLAESCEGVEERRARVMLDYIGEALCGSLNILKAIKLVNKK
jgi:hypothetical protein